MSRKVYLASGGWVDESEARLFKSAAANRKVGDTRLTLHINLKSDLGTATSATGSGALWLEGTDAGHQYGGIVPSDYRPFAEPTVFAPGAVLAALRSEPTSSNSVTVVRGADTVNGTDVVAEGTAHPGSQATFTPHLFPVKRVGTLFPVTTDALEDTPRVLDYLSRRARRLVALKIDAELVTGDGTGEHIIGLQHTVSRTLTAQGSDDIDVAVARNIEAVYAAGGQVPTAILMNASTWLSYLTVRAASSNTLQAGGVSLVNARQAWGATIVLSPAVPTSRIFTVAPAFGSVAVRTELVIETSEGYGGYFGEGLTALRAYRRVGLPVEIPSLIGEVLLGS